MAEVETLTLYDMARESALQVASTLEAGERDAALPSQKIFVAESIDAVFDDSPDCLIIATPTPAHAPLLRRAIEHGIPSFCEKPVSLEMAVLDDLIERAQARDALVQIGFQRRFDPMYVAAAESCAAGRFGPLFLVRTTGHDPEPPHHTYVAGSGGIYRDLHIHDFDCIQYVTGQRITEVYADGSVLVDDIFAEHDDVDTSAMVMRLETGTLVVSSGLRQCVGGYDVRMELIGDRDAVSIGDDDRIPIVPIGDGPGRAGRPQMYRGFLERFADAYRAEIRAFVDTVRSGGPSPVTLEDARSALQVAVAAAQSRVERRPVTVGSVQ